MASMPKSMQKSMPDKKRGLPAKAGLVEAGLRNAILTKARLKIDSLVNYHALKSVACDYDNVVSHLAG